MRLSLWLGQTAVCRCSVRVPRGERRVFGGGSYYCKTQNKEGVSAQRKVSPPDLASVSMPLFSGLWPWVLFYALKKMHVDLSRQPWDMWTRPAALREMDLQPALPGGGSHSQPPINIAKHLRSSRAGPGHLSFRLCY